MQKTIVKYKGLELLCKVETVSKYREGKIKLDDCLLADIVFKNASKGDRASDSDLKQVFDTADVDTCIKIMLDKGDFQLTKKEMKEKVDKRRKQIVVELNDLYMNPKNGLPYTVGMWDSILTEHRINVNLDESIERQVANIHKQLLGKVGMSKLEQLELILELKHSYWGSVSATVYQNGTVVREKFGPKTAKFELQTTNKGFMAINAKLSAVTSGDHYLEHKSTYEKLRSTNKVDRRPTKGRNKNKTQ